MMRSLIYILFKSFQAILLSIILTGAIAFARPTSTSVPKEMKELPPSVVQWWIYETAYMSDEADPIRIADIAQNDQNPKYRPAAQNVFNLVGYWVPADDLEIFVSKVPEQLRALITRQVNGRTEMLFFIHPESLEIYSEIVHKPGIEKLIFKAVPTSSSRGLLVWKPGHEHFPFVAKLSLNREVSESLRVINGIETQYSIEISKILHESKISDGGGFMDEVLSLIPKGRDSGGEIFRVLPQAMLNGEMTLAPFYAFYGGSQSVEQGALMKELVIKSGLSPVDFLRLKIIRPFVRMWVDMALKGITMEPHAQNMLTSLIHGDIGPHFFRDLGGFDVDIEYRKLVGLSVPADPRNEYFRDPGGYNVNHDKYLAKSLDRYFNSAFLYGVDVLFRKWRKAGVFKIEKLEIGWAKEILLGELAAEFSERLGQKVKLRSDFRDVAQKIRMVREIQNGRWQCQKIFKMTSPN